MRRFLLAAVLLPVLAGSASAQIFGAPFAQPWSPSVAQPWSVCRGAASIAERSGPVAIPPHLLAAIARIESGRRDPQTGRATPWPWTINAEGQGFFFESKAEAMAAVRGLQARGVRSVDVGCMQINLLHHPTAFGSLEEAFDPHANAAYGARFLTQLHERTGDWGRATGMYHSATPELGADYQRRVFAAWPEEKDGPASASIQVASASASRPAPILPASPGAVALPFARSDNARIIPLISGLGGSGGPPGRGLDAYRSAPIAMASRVLTRSLGG